MKSVAVRGKKFDQDLYNRNDDAKHVVIKWLSTQGYDAHVNPDDYGIDLLAFNPETRYECQFEVEVKHNWSGPSFPFDTIHIPARKLKFVSPTAYFVMLNHERTHLLLFRSERLANAPIVTKTTTYTAREEFVEIPFDDWFLIPINEGETYD